MSDDGPKFTSGRLGRLAKLAGMSAKISTELVGRGVNKLRGQSGDLSMMTAATAEKLVATLGDLKGLAMKMGQAMSMDPDMLTPEVRAVISRLQNQAPPMPWRTVEQVIFEQLKGAPAEVYASFEQTPMASASLGQVHRAVTKAGMPVAVKVQYPDIAKALDADLDNLGGMVTAVSAATRIGHARGYFAELREGLLEELDYREEAQRAEVFRAASARVSSVVVPRVEHALTSEKVLTLELLGGHTLKEFLNTKGPTTTNAELFRVSRLLIEAIWGTFLVSGVIHADPHPGNFLLLPDGKIGVLDFGAIKTISDRFLKVARYMFSQAEAGKTFDAIQVSLDCGFTFDQPDEAREIVERIIEIALRPVYSRDFDYANTGINREMRNLFIRNATKMPGIRPPTESIQFYRALGGLSQNLQTLGARGDFHEVFSRLNALL